jgi:EAL domain-containing protein (putative c-di-GMP-specific phosphodiesterase class I)
MWRCSCEILKRWEKMGYDDLFISINVSPTDFYFMDVKEVLKNTVREFDISPSRLRVEITESVMMNDDIDKFEILKDLQSSGFIVEMDDFGSGYSSLNMLKNMPVDVIKLDMMFVNDMNNVSRTSTILRNVINMMVELGLTPLTEGIETKEQYDILSRMGCKMFQGYLFAKPMPVEDFEREFLKERDCIESSSK